MSRLNTSTLIGRLVWTRSVLKAEENRLSAAELLSDELRDEMGRLWEQIAGMLAEVYREVGSFRDCERVAEEGLRTTLAGQERLAIEWEYEKWLCRGRRSNNQAETAGAVEAIRSLRERKTRWPSASSERRFRIKTMYGEMGIRVRAVEKEYVIGSDLEREREECARLFGEAEEEARSFVDGERGGRYLCYLRCLRGRLEYLTQASPDFDLAGEYLSDGMGAVVSVNTPSDRTALAVAHLNRAELSVLQARSRRLEASMKFEEEGCPSWHAFLDRALIEVQQAERLLLTGLRNATWWTWLYYLRAATICEWLRYPRLASVAGLVTAVNEARPMYRMILALRSIHAGMINHLHAGRRHERFEARWWDVFCAWMLGAHETGALEAEVDFRRRRSIAGWKCFNQRAGTVQLFEYFADMKRLPTSSPIAAYLSKQEVRDWQAWIDDVMVEDPNIIAEFIARIRSAWRPSGGAADGDIGIL